MTPAAAAREVASVYGCAGTREGDLITEAFTRFADLLDRYPAQDVIVVRRFDGATVRTATTGHCRTCGPTATEEHPRLPVIRCANCKEPLVRRDECPACHAHALDRWHGQMTDAYEPDQPHAECGACGYIE